MGNAEGKEALSSHATQSSLPASSSSTTPLLSQTQAIIRRHQPNRLPADRNFLNVLVIIGGEERERYARYFANHGKLYGTHELRVYCVLWADIRLSSYSSARQGLQCQVDLRLEHEKRYVSITVDFVLIRSQVVGARPEEDWRNVLYGFMYANVPSVNTFHSIYMASQRVLMMGECNRIREVVGHENYPIVDQNYYARAQDMAISPSFPAVLKVSGSHAGFGKTIVTDHHHWADLRSLVMVTGHYATAEEFIEGDYDLRIQRIASGVEGQPAHYRCLKRINISGNWKGNTGSAIMEIEAMTEEYQRWADLSSQLFGGLDILAVDVIHCSKTGKEYILEVNDTSIGLAPDEGISQEDEMHIVELCINRIKQHYPNPADLLVAVDSESSSSSVSAVLDSPASTESQTHSSIVIPETEEEAADAPSREQLPLERGTDEICETEDPVEIQAA